MHGNNFNADNFTLAARQSKLFMNLELLRTTMSTAEKLSLFNYYPDNRSRPQKAEPKTGGPISHIPNDLRRVSSLDAFRHIRDEDDRNLSFRKKQTDDSSKHQGSSRQKNQMGSFHSLNDTLNNLEAKLSLAKSIFKQPSLQLCAHQAQASQPVKLDRIVIASNSGQSQISSISDLEEDETISQQLRQAELRESHLQRNKYPVKSSSSTDVSKLHGDSLRPPCLRSSKSKLNLNALSQSNRISYRQYYVGEVAALIKNEQAKKLEPSLYRRFIDHVNLSFNIYSNINKFEALELSEVKEYQVKIPLLPRNTGKKTLLLDIDDTLLICDEAKCEGVDYDMELDIAPEEDSDFQKVRVYIKLRPYALTFLKNMSKIFEIVAFTGSVEKYAGSVLKQIDPEQQIFSYKLYRDSCFELCSGVYVKDIRIINRRPENVILVDNSPYSYIYQPENGVPIVPYEKTPDEELLKLERYLHCLDKCSDVREANKDIFKLHRYKQFKDASKMIEALY